MAERPAQETDRPRVLVVQSERISTTVLRRMVERLGLACETTSDLDEARGRLARGGLAAAVVDLGLHGAEGQEVARDLRRTAGPTTVLVGTSIDHDLELAAACAAEAVRLLPHPVAVDDLAHALDEVVRRGREPGPAVDISVLTELAEQIGDPGLAREIVRTYLDELPDRRARLEAGRTAGADLEDVQRAAHSFKSASATVGALPLSEACARVETALRRGESQGLPDQVEKILALLPEVDSQLEAWMAAGTLAGPSDDQDGSNR